MKYNVNDKLPLKALALYGTQWFVLAIAVVTTSVFVATGTPAEKLFFAQKLFAVMGITGLLQVLIGHRLPIVVGPAAVLLVGVLSALSAGASNTAIYSSIAVGGAFILLLNIGGLLRYVQRLFSARSVIVILMLIAFTLAPVIRNLIFPPTANNEEHTFGLIFTFIALPLMVMMNGRLRGVAKSLVIPIVLVLGSVAYGICFGYELNTATSASLDTLLIWVLSSLLQRLQLRLVLCISLCLTAWVTVWVWMFTTWRMLASVRSTSRQLPSVLQSRQPASTAQLGA